MANVFVPVESEVLEGGGDLLLDRVRLAGRRARLVIGRTLDEGRREADPSDDCASREAWGSGYSEVVFLVRNRRENIVDECAPPLAAPVHDELDANGQLKRTFSLTSSRLPSPQSDDPCARRASSRKQPTALPTIPRMHERLQELREAEFDAAVPGLTEADWRLTRPQEVDESGAGFPARGLLDHLWAVTAERPFRFRPGRWGRLRGLALIPIKAFLRPLMRWYVEPLAAEQREFNAGVLRLADELSAALDRLEKWNRDRVEQIDQLWQQNEQLSQHLPVVLNAIATQNATAREFERVRSDFAARLEDYEARLTTLAENLTYVDRRGEFIRREVMYEARYGAQSRGVEHVAAEDVDLSRLPQPLRLNLGSGHVPREGYVNVDARKLDGVDVAADVRRLPFEPGTVEEIYSSHLVEHFPIEELRSVVLPHWRDLLRPGGRLVAVVPDAEAMVRETAKGRMPFDDFQRVMFGDQEYDGDFHFSTYTPDSLSALFAEAGFKAVEIVDRARRNGLAYEFEIIGERPAAEKAEPEQVPAGNSVPTE